jgi:hypothetical protein
VIDIVPNVEHGSGLERSVLARQTHMVRDVIDNLVHP